MKEIREGELVFRFPENAQVEKFDAPGKRWPKGIAPVDILLESSAETTLIEVKDPSASSVPENERRQYVHRMQTRELTHEELAPKARGTYTFLHLMGRDKRSMRYVVVLGTEKLSMQPALLLNLTDRLRKRLAQESEQPWQRTYIQSCVVVATSGVPKALPGCSVERIAS